jgi:hypothetical protein
MDHFLFIFFTLCITLAIIAAVKIDQGDEKERTQKSKKK